MDAERWSQLKELVLDGSWVRLEPLSPVHVASLVALGDHPELQAQFRYFTDRLQTPQDREAHLEGLMQRSLGSGWMAFAIVHRSSGQPIGSTSYLDISPSNSRLEIGSTWLAPQWWRTPINTECKLLLLQHAFEQLGCTRVQLKTDLRNTRSQQAIERLGAVREAVLRNHMVMSDGYWRTTVMYSLLPDEWPPVRERLKARLASG